MRAQGSGSYNNTETNIICSTGIRFNKKTNCIKQKNLMLHLKASKRNLWVKTACLTPSLLCTVKKRYHGTDTDTNYVLSNFQ
jgi:hypothetical protein